MATEKRKKQREHAQERKRTWACNELVLKLNWPGTAYSGTPFAIGVAALASSNATTGKSDLIILKCDTLH
jgi:hypothetical protein